MKMSLSELLATGRLHRHSATQGETHDFMVKAQRASHDAEIDTISVDNRFVIAYHGALSAATAVVAAAGYRPAAVGHHQTVFEAFPLIIDGMTETAEYLDACRRRRHQALYGRVGQIAQSELDELLVALADLIAHTKQWLVEEHPDLYRGPD